MQQVKVKIKKLANGGGPKPLYQQDEAKGLNAYFLPTQYKDNDEGTDTINHNQEIVEEEEANVELELGEVVFDLMSDIPQMRNVLGKKHKDKGTLAKLEEGAFVFSDHLKLSEGEQKVLDAKGKKPSYASFIKQFVKPFNESVKIVNISEDQYDKETAALNLLNIKNKAAKTALLQESAKGFPQGTPEFIQGEETQMKEGGMYKMQDGSTYTEKEGRKYRIVKGDQAPKEVPDFATDQFDYYDMFGNKTVGKKGAPDFNRAFGIARKQGLKEFTWKGKRYNTNMGGKTPDDFVAIPNAMEEDPMTKYPQPYEDIISAPPIIGSPSKDGTSLVDTPIIQNKGINANNAGKTFKKPYKDTGYGWMESLSIANAAMQPINRYAPIKKRIEAQNLKFKPVDFEAQRQSVKGQVQQAQDVNTLLSPTSAAASARNSELLGKSLNTLNESFMNEFNTNQMGYQQIEGQNAQFNQQADLFNTQMADQYDAQYAQMNENFDARKAGRNSNVMKQWQSAEKSRQTRNMLNYLMTDYQIGPNQEVTELPQSKEQRMARITNGSGMTSQSQNIFDQMKALEEEAKSKGYTLTTEQLLNMVNKQKTDYSEVDTDNDGIPNTTRRMSNTPSSLNMMYRLLQGQF